jgi:hypothetical protein
MTVSTEPWLSKQDLARHFACSVRSVEFAVADGMPHAIVFGRVKFRASEAEIWLEKNGRLERRGDQPIHSQTKKWPGSAVNATGP